MKTDQLQYFVTTAQIGHLGKAAKVLNISPSAISHSIASLESELGQALFLRQSKKLVLTSHGQVLLEKARVVLDDLQKIKEELSQNDLQYQGTLKMGATHGLHSFIWSKSLDDIQTQFSKITFELYSLRSASVVEETLAGDLDVGICFSPQSHPDLKATVLHSGKLLFACRKNHPILEMTEKKKIEFMQEIPHCAPKAFKGIESCEKHPILQKMGITPKVGMIFDSYSVVIEYLLRSDAWTLLPDVFVAQNSNLVPIFKDQEKPTYHISAISHRGRFQSKPIQLWMENAKEQFEKYTL
ncbi:MAG: LysR family transcriptional regulator [Pseudobdellovibrionaceae bacterium]